MARTRGSQQEEDRRLLAADPKTLSEQDRLARRRAQNRRYYRQRLARMSAADRAAFRKNKTTQVIARYHSLDAEERKRRNRRVYLKVTQRAQEATPEAKKEATAKRQDIFRRWYYKNHSANVQRQKERRELLPDSEKARRREGARNRAAKDRAKRTDAEWSAIIRYQADYNRRRAKDDPAFKMMQAVRARINMAIRRRNSRKPDVRTERLLGCDWEQFTRHIENLFHPGMTWDNWGRNTWHIDHVVPLAAFDLADPQECAVACNFRNHRPLWASDNMTKAAAMPNRKTVAPALRRMLLALDPSFFTRNTYRSKRPRLPKKQSRPSSP